MTKRFNRSIDQLRDESMSREEEVITTKGKLLLNKYILPDDVIKRMKNAGKRVDHLKEQCTFLCAKKDDNKIIDKDYLEGIECAKFTEPVCDRDETILGSFYSSIHTIKGGLVTTPDVNIAYKHGVACSYNLHKHGVRCISRKENPTKEGLSEMKSLILSNDNIMKKGEDINKKFDEFVDRNYHKLPIDDIDFPKSLVQKMKRASRKSFRIDREIGFALCSRNGDIIGRNMHIGTSRGVKTTYCDHGEEYIGYFHTHPRTFAKPSIGDIHGAYTNRASVECIGTKNEINCLVTKQMYDDKDQQLIDDLYDSENKKDLEEKEHVDKLRKFVNKNFDIINCE